MSERVIVIAGGLSPERDVSLRSGRRVVEELRDAGFDAEVRDVDASLVETLRTDPPACAIPLVHGVAGEDGSLQEVLQALNIPFVGSEAASCRISFDKAICATLVRNAGIPAPKAAALPQATFRDLGAAALLTAMSAEIGLPLVVKPNRMGSALGVAIAKTADELPAAMVGAFSYCDVALIQEYVAGTEIAVAVAESDAGPQALPPVEIVPDTGIYDYTARYTAGTTEFFVPARLDDVVLERAQQVAVSAHKLLGLRDWSRTDMIVDHEGTPWFLEVNVAPGMTETSLFPQAVAASGKGMAEVLTALVKRATDRG